MPSLFCFGLGYTARHLGLALMRDGWRVGGTVRSADKAAGLRSEGFAAVVFDGREPGDGVPMALDEASHVLSSVGPDDRGDPVLRHHGETLGQAPHLGWLGYLSTIGVYGDRQGAWVDEDDAPAFDDARAKARLDGEAAWLALGSDARPVQIFRLGGIYGPRRNALVQVEAGTARRIVKPGQVFNRVHVDDIVATLVASMARPRNGGIYNVVDGAPSAPEDPVEYAAALLALEPPAAVDFDAAEMSPMARAFYSSSRRVRNARIQDELGVRLLYPSYREGLAALLEDGRDRDNDDTALP